MTWREYICIIVVVLVLILTLIDFFVYSSKKRKQQTLYCRIKDTIRYSRLPIIMLETHRGRHLNFVLDTGATQSYIRRSTVEECRFPINTHHRTRTYSVDSESVQNESVALTLRNNGYIFEERFVVNDMERILTRVENDSGYHIDGLLGMSFMLRYIVSIDFKRRKIYFSRLEKENVKTKNNARKDDLCLQGIGDKREVRKCNSRVRNGGTRKDKGNVPIHKTRLKESGCNGRNV